jgi:hypothetical protein
MVVRGALRVLAPITVVWGIAAWWFVGALPAVMYGLLVWNYVLVYILTWTAPKAIHGPWRVRPVQTFIVLGNSFVLPWMYYARGWPLPWGFLAMCIVYHIALFVSTYILLYLQEHLPMGGIFAQQRTGLLRGLDGSAWGQGSGRQGG